VRDPGPGYKWLHECCKKCDNLGEDDHLTSPRFIGKACKAGCNMWVGSNTCKHFCEWRDHL